jgi:hypothetical protein
MKRKLMMAALPAFVLAILVAACSQPTGGGGGGSVPAANTGSGKGTFAKLIGIWVSDDGKLEYEIEDYSNGYGLISINAEPPYKQWADYFFVISEKSVTKNRVVGASYGYIVGTSSFDYVLSDNDQTLTVSNFYDAENDPDLGLPAALNFNGVLRKQP